MIKAISVDMLCLDGCMSTLIVYARAEVIGLCS